MIFSKNVLNGDEPSSSAATHPCSNCPSTCTLCPSACEECKPYKEKLLDAIYWVEHKDELVAKYEVTGSAAEDRGTTVCPYCGGPTADPYVCEYCGTQLQEGSEKIRVASAADIPNPVLEAQDIIFERYANVVAKYDSSASSQSSSGSLLGSLLDMVLSDGDDKAAANPLGNRMTEQEITQTASACGVSVAQYLNGLDAGTYPTAAKYAVSRNGQTSSGRTVSSGAAGMAGVAGAAGVLGSLLGSNAASSSRTGIRRMPPRPQDGSFGGMNGMNGRPFPGQGGPGSGMRMPEREHGNFSDRNSSGSSGLGSTISKITNAFDTASSSGRQTGSRGSQGGRGGRGPGGRGPGGR